MTMPLFDAGPALTVKRCRSPVHPQPCYHGSCSDCGEVFTAFDATEDECRELGESLLAKHDCPKHPKPAEDPLTGEFPAGY